MATATGKSRIRQAIDTGAKTIMSASPFCTWGLRDTADSDEIDVIDPAEMIDELTIGSNMAASKSP